MVYFSLSIVFNKENTMNRPDNNDAEIISTNQTPVPEGQANDMQNTSHNPNIAPGQVEDDLNIDDYIQPEEEKKGIPAAVWVGVILLTISIAFGLLIYILTWLSGGEPNIEKPPVLTTVEETNTPDSLGAPIGESIQAENGLLIKLENVSRLPHDNGTADICTTLFYENVGENTVIIDPMNWQLTDPQNINTTYMQGSDQNQLNIPGVESIDLYPGDNYRGNICFPLEGGEGVYSLTNTRMFKPEDKWQFRP